MAKRLNKELLKMAQESVEKAAAIPADQAGGGMPAPAVMDPMAGGGAPPPPAGAMPPGAAPGAPPTMGAPMDPAMGAPPAPAPAAPAAKPKLDPIHIEKRLHDMHKMVAQMAGSMGIQIPPEATVEPPAGEMQAQMEQSMAQEQADPTGQVPPAPGVDPAAAAGGMDPAAAGAGMSPPGGGIGDIGGLSGMKAAHMINTLHILVEKVARHVLQGGPPAPMGRPINQPTSSPTPSAIPSPVAAPATPLDIRNKSAATASILRQRALNASRSS